MTRRLAGSLVLAAVVLTTGRSLTAHHSFAAEYDPDKPVTLKGSVTKIEWANPHVYFYIDVADAAGVTANWAIEGGAPNSLYRAGWRKDMLKVGDVVTVQGYLARDGSKLANMRTAVMSDGREIFGGQSYYTTSTSKPPGPPGAR